MPVRSKRTTRRAAPRRKVTRTRKIARPWSREEMSFMRKYYRKYETSWIGRQLGRTVYSIRYKAVDMHLKKANPSVWRGNRGAANAFRKPTTRRTTTAKKRYTQKRTKSTRTWRASSMRRTRRTRK
ncbi:MAG: hypothetical protein KAT79_07100 [candidate division Zixibacteria bacterium]|nr:hypothetical protein [candidate division Zixibacteria bacterium]